ncbi:unnamed protein product [Rhodiola kirilowii]
MANLLGFRRPQFSEEAAWLPDWLQNSQTTACDKLTKESDEAHIKLSEGNVIEKAREDSQYHNCCLFLSGADSAAFSLASPSASVLHLNLHLSSDGNLQYTQSLPFDSYQADIAKEMSLLLKPMTTAVPEVIPESPCSKGKSHVKRSKEGPYKDGHFDHAVEISIAASEALLIHELLENEESSAVVSALDLLDVSLKVKQARLHWVEENSLSNDQLNESVDYLSDLDDSSMADAFLDVGLCATSGDRRMSDSIMSPLNRSPQIDLEADNHFGQSEVPILEVTVGCTPEKFSEENLDMDINSAKELQHDVTYRDGKYPVLKCDIGGLELCTTSQENAQSETAELVNIQAELTMPKPDPRPPQPQPQPQLTANSSQSQDQKAPEDCQLKHHLLGRFNSGWLGGWTKKDDSPYFILDTKTYTSNALAVETSSLSESIDVPDKSSYVDGQESKLLTSAQAGTAVNVTALTNMIKDEMLISPEIAKHSSSPSIDPLCSVVPCSLLSDTPQSVQIGQLFQKVGEDLNKNVLCIASRDRDDSVNFTSELMVRVQGMPTVNNKDSDIEVQKRSASLNKYSVLLPSQNKIGMDPISHDQFVYQCINGKESCHSKGEVGIPTRLPEQELPVLQIKGIQFLHAAEGLCRDEKLDRFAYQKVSDDIPLQKTTHVSPMDVTCAQNIQVPRRKRVRFKEDEAELEQSKWLHIQKRTAGSEFISTPKSKKLRILNRQPERETYSQEVKRKLTNCSSSKVDKLIFHGLEFLLTGFSKKREKEVEQLIISYGGIVLLDIPSPSSEQKITFQSNCQKLPVVLCLKKVETTKFLFGCAINACILKVDWLLDSVSAGSVLQPEKYMVLSNQADGRHTTLTLPRVCKLIFEGVGIMFHGKRSFCTSLSMIFKYGGGRVFKTLQSLVQSSERKKLTIQVVVAEDRSMVSRHLKHCALERSLPVVPASWIINSFHSGKLLPFTESDYNFPKPMKKTSLEMPQSLCLSQEI